MVPPAVPVGQILIGMWLHTGRDSFPGMQVAGCKRFKGNIQHFVRSQKGCKPTE